MLTHKIVIKQIDNEIGTYLDIEDYDPEDHDNEEAAEFASDLCESGEYTIIKEVDDKTYNELEKVMLNFQRAQKFLKDL